MSASSGGFGLHPHFALRAVVVPVSRVSGGDLHLDIIRAIWAQPSSLGNYPKFAFERGNSGGHFNEVNKPTNKLFPNTKRYMEVTHA